MYDYHTFEAYFQELIQGYQVSRSTSAFAISNFPIFIPIRSLIFCRIPDFYLYPGTDSDAYWDDCSKHGEFAQRNRLPRKENRASATGFVQNDKDMLAPRIGFAYDLTGGGKQPYGGGWHGSSSESGK